MGTLFCLQVTFENYFSSQATLFKIVSYDKVTTSAKQKNLVFLMLLWTVFDQISVSRRSMLLFLLPEKGPRAALWPCLNYSFLYLPYISLTAEPNKWLPQ